MKFNFIAYGVLLSIFLAVTICCLPLLSDKKPLPTLNPTYLPGKIAELKNCYWYDFYHYELFYIPCSTDGLYYYVTPDRHIIKSVMLIPDNLTIGDFILQWGTPIGYRRHNGVVEVIWTNKRVYTTKTFTPNSKAIVVVYQDNKDIVYWTWRGFSTRETN